MLAAFAVWAPATDVARARPGAEVRLTVAPIPTATEPSPGTPRVTWSTGNGSPGRVMLAAPGGGETEFAWGDSGSSEAPWIKAGQVYEFRLYAIGSGRRLLARMRVGGGRARTDVVAPPPRPRDTPEVVDRLLQILPFAGLIALCLLGTSWVREARRDG